MASKGRNQPPRQSFRLTNENDMDMNSQTESESVLDTTLESKPYQDGDPIYV